MAVYTETSTELCKYLKQRLNVCKIKPVLANLISVRYVRNTQRSYETSKSSKKSWRHTLIDSINCIFVIAKLGKNERMQDLIHHLKLTVRACVCVYA